MHLKNKVKMVFNNYAKYYNLLYKDKNYKKEIDFIVSLIKQHTKNKNLRILDIGCGTGIHANFLAEQGYQVTGIDLSEKMIKIAQENKNDNTKFYVADATSFNLDDKFDIILSLFHVVSYQSSNKDISNMFSNVSKHLKKDGLFIFDFWYGPAVLTEQPSIKIKRIENDEIKIVRIAEPTINNMENIVNVNYEIIIYNKSKKTIEFINELHKMRYFSIPEINIFINDVNMGVVDYAEWLTNVKPSSHSWGVYCVALQN